MTFGEKLKEARKRAGLSQEQLAEAFNVSRSAVAKWENDIGIPDVSNLKNISKLLNVSIDYLLDENGNPDTGAEHVQLDDDSIEPCLEYEGYYYDIELNGWNDGVADVKIIGQDSKFLYYQKYDKKKLICGMIGKNYIVSVSKTKKIKDIKDMAKARELNKLYFVDKHVQLEVAHKDGIIKGFFDMRNDDYMDVVIKRFDEKEVELLFGHKIDINTITKIEEL